MTVQYSLGLTVEGSSTVEGSLTVSQEDDKNWDHLLTGCQAFMRYDTCHDLIGFCPRSKRRFIFRAFHIYILHFSSLISPFFSQNVLSERHRHPCQRAFRRISIPVIYTTVDLQLLRLGEYYYYYFTSLALVLFIFLDFHTHPSTLLDPSVLGFVVTCRQCLVRQVISR